MKQRELRPCERNSIKKLVYSSCANFDKEYGCLPMDWPCYMCHKYYTGAFCLYFKQNVLPLNPTLCASLEEITLETKVCKYCQKSFIPTSKEWYCSLDCRQQARKTTFRKSQQKHHANVNK